MTPGQFARVEQLLDQLRSEMSALTAHVASVAAGHEARLRIAEERVRDLDHGLDKVKARQNHLAGACAVIASLAASVSTYIAIHL